MERYERDAKGVEAGINPWPFAKMGETPRVIIYRCVDCLRTESSMKLSATPGAETILTWTRQNIDVVRAVKQAKIDGTWGTDVTTDTVIDEVGEDTGIDPVPDM